MGYTKFKSNQLISSVRVYSIKKNDSLNRHDSQLSSDGVYSVPLLATRRLSLLLLKDHKTKGPMHLKNARNVIETVD